MSDILFLPSAWEGISLTVYEAMASGLAVVGAAVGGQAELVIDGTGVLIQRSTPEQEAQQYAVALKRMIDDPQMRCGVPAQRGERVEQHFSLGQMGDRMVSLFASPGACVRRNRVCLSHQGSAVRLRWRRWKVIATDRTGGGMPGSQTLQRW